MGANCFSHCTDSERNAPCDWCRKHTADRPNCCKKKEGETSGHCPDTANYVDLGFTVGDATSYHQCVSPVTKVEKASSLVEVEQPRIKSEAEKALEKRAAREAARKVQSLLEERSKVQAKASMTLDLSTTGKPDKDKEKKSGDHDLSGTHAPLCDVNSDFSASIEGFGGWCYKPCLEGYEMVEKDGEDDEKIQTEQCKTKCPAKSDGG